MELMRFFDRNFIKKPAFRRFLTKLIFGNKDLDIVCFGTYLSINTVRENGYLAAFRLSRFSSVFRDEVSVLINLSTLITNNSTFVDIGANVGLFTSTMSRFQHFYSNVRMYAFEPNPDTFARLAKTVQGKDIKIFNLAVSDTEENLEFVEGAVSHVFTEKSHFNHYHYKKQLKNQNFITIKSKRLDQFDIEGDEIILKIDVEGHELKVLNGAKSLFEQNRIKAVYLDGYNNDENVIGLLQNYGFRLLNGRNLKSFQKGDFSVLAIKHTLQ